MYESLRKSKTFKACRATLHKSPAFFVVFFKSCFTKMVCHGDVRSFFFMSIYDLLSSPALYKPGPSLAQSVKISPKIMIQHVTFFSFIQH